MTRSYITD